MFWFKRKPVVNIFRITNGVEIEYAKGYKPIKFTLIVDGKVHSVDELKLKEIKRFENLNFNDHIKVIVKNNMGIDIIKQPKYRELYL